MSTNLEFVLKHSYKEDMILYIKSHPEEFENLIKLALSNNSTYAWRASWLLWSCIDENDLRVQPYIDEIINTIETKKEGHQRELLILLNKMKLSENQMGILFEICVNLYTNTHKKPSTRLTSLKLMVKISHFFPELQNEIKFFSDLQFTNTLSTASKKSVLKTISNI